MWLIIVASVILPILVWDYSYEKCLKKNIGEERATKCPGLCCSQKKEAKSKEEEPKSKEKVCNDFIF